MYQSGLVDILDPITNEVISHCCGPTVEGSCPLANRDGVVLCNGCRIAGRVLDLSTGISGFRQHPDTAPWRGSWNQWAIECASARQRFPAPTRSLANDGDPA